MSSIHIQLPSKHPICRVLKSDKLDERIETSIIFVIDNLCLETNDWGLNNESWLDHHAGDYFSQGVVPDWSFQKNRK